MSWPQYSAMVSHEHGVLWFKVRKCASTSIYRMLPEADWKRVTSSRLYPLYGKFRYKNYFKFAFVRNPFDRLLSNYTHKIANRKKSEIRPSYIRPLNFREDMSFEEFAIQVCELPDAKCDRHYRSMHKLIDVDNMDFIGRLENFDHDMKNIFSKKFGEKNIVPPHVNKSKDSGYSKYYSDEIRDRVQQRYKKDLEIFNYQFEQDS